MSVNPARTAVIALGLAVCLLAGTAAGPLPAGAAGPGLAGADVGDGLTVIRRVVVGKPEIDARRIPLLALYAEPGGGAPLVSADWAVDESGWFPIWNLKVSVHLGQAGSGSPGERILLQGPVTPVTGHEYEVALSYSYEEGLLALSLSDVTDGRVLETGEWPIAIAPGVRLHALRREGEALVPWYAPVGMRWDVVERSHGGFIPKRQVALGDDAGLRLVSSGPVKGALRMVVRAGGKVYALLESAPGVEFIPIDVSRLPAGPVSVALQYILNETVVWESVEKRIVVGRVSGRIEQAAFNREENAVDLSVALSADRPLEGITLRWVAELVQRTWDGQASGFAGRPYGVREGELAGVESNESRALVRIPLPAEPGLWRLDLRFDAAPEVAASLEPSSLTVSTELGAVLGARTGDARTVRVCTYNMLNFEGWPQEEARKDLGGPADPRRIDYFTQVIRGLDCDIIGIQEGYSVDVMRTVGHRLGLNVAPFASSTRFPGGTLTRFAILESRMFNHAGVANQNMPFSRFGGASLLEIEGELVWLVNFHAWPHDEEMRAREAQVLGRQLDQLAAVTPHLIVLGDFNSGPGAAIDRALRERGLVNAMYLDWITGGKPAIDHIYVSRDLAGRVVAGWVESGPGFVNDGSSGRSWANSDHRPTIVELVWPGSGN